MYLHLNHNIHHTRVPLYSLEATKQVLLTDTTASLTPSQIKHIRQVVGTLLYYSQAVDPTLAVALSAIASRQSQCTEAVMDTCKQLHDYVTNHPNATIRYCASDMMLALDTDGLYLFEPGGSRAAAYMYLTKRDEPDCHDGSVLVLLAIIKHIMASASKPKLVALFYGFKEAIPLHTALKEMGHPQPGPTLVTMENSTSVRLTMQQMLPKASKAMDMHFQWLKCCHAQQLFCFFWAKCQLNHADYPSKCHPPAHYIKVQSQLHDTIPTQ